MDIRGGGGGASHTKNPNQIFPYSFICFRRNISLSLSLTRARAFLRSYIFVSNIEPNVYHPFRHDRECFVATTKATSRGNRWYDPNEKTFLVRLFVYLTSFRSSTLPSSVLLYTRCHSNFLTISLPLSSKFRTRTSIFAPYSLNSRMRVPIPPELLLPEKVTGSNYRKTTDYLVQGRSLGRNKRDDEQWFIWNVTLEKPAETIRCSIEVSAT